MISLTDKISFVIGAAGETGPTTGKVLADLGAKAALPSLHDSGK
ncbi:hypothetical protein OS189_14140 [Sulfitobacter sp. F26169L]|nr:hypothetical protein [Sulfitobacter sp. F26169L]MCX7567486.1 hypothetical protein [Sulfitobacter sp. F26169L]